jgi:hypothetical protein
MEPKTRKMWAEFLHGFNEGWWQGIDLGRRQARQDGVLRVLRHSPFGLPEDLEKEIRSLTDMARLQSAFDAALSSSSLEEFRQKTGL